MHNNIDFVPIITSTMPFPISRPNNVAVSPPSIVAKIGTRWKICLEHSNTNDVFIIIRLYFVVRERGQGHKINPSKMYCKLLALVVLFSVFVITRQCVQCVQCVPSHRGVKFN